MISAAATADDAEWRSRSESKRRDDGDNDDEDEEDIPHGLPSLQDDLRLPALTSPPNLSLI